MYIFLLVLGKINRPGQLAPPPPGGEDNQGGGLDIQGQLATRGARCPGGHGFEHFTQIKNKYFIMYLFIFHRSSPHLLS